MTNTARHAALLEQLRAEADARSPARPDPSPRTKDAPQAYDFADLPDYRPIRMQKAALKAMGLSHPFFRLGEGSSAPETQVEGRAQLSFASYDYLGLNRHEEVREAAREAIRRWGVSPSASRLVGGERPYHRSLDAALATMQGTEAALAMVSGHATNVGTIAALLGPKDLIILDQYSHNSVVEGARLSGATRLVAPHNDCAWIEATLERCRKQHRHVLIAVEGLYSMDGDTPDLQRLVAIKARFDAWLMVDEAHALGCLGATGRGLAEGQGVDPRSVEIWMGTLSKTLAACGGYICGSAALIDYLMARAPGFVFSVGLAAPVAATAECAIGLLAREPERAARLAHAGQRFLAAAKAAGLDTGLSEGHAITPVLIGDSLRAVRASAALFEQGINALPIIHPAVPERAARLRFFLTCDHTDAMIDQAVEATASVLRTL
ncbi:MAG: aminotransferase class I/II-fold pyridoxal phosphate-dependent enzyme [Pseudomonadota bacterium]